MVKDFIGILLTLHFLVIVNFTTFAQSIEGSVFNVKNWEGRPIFRIPSMFFFIVCHDNHNELRFPCSLILFFSQDFISLQGTLAVDGEREEEKRRIHTEHPVGCPSLIPWTQHSNDKIATQNLPPSVRPMVARHLITASNSQLHDWEMLVNTAFCLQNRH